MDIMHFSLLISKMQLTNEKHEMFALSAPLVYRIVRFYARLGNNLTIFTPLCIHVTQPYVVK